MKKYIGIAVASLLVISSCSEGTMDYINKNTANPAYSTVAAKNILTDAIMSTGFSTSSGDYAFYVSSLTEQEFGTGNNQLKQAELRSKNEWAASTTFNNVWNSTYANIGAIRQILEKTSEGGMNEDQIDILGMAQTLFALNIGILTDMHGDVPCSEAGFGLSLVNPKPDAQKDIYNDAILGNLDKAIANLTDAVNDKISSAGKQDILFGGSVKKWLGFAYALKARYLLHTYAVDKSVLSKVVEAGEAALSAGFEGAEIASFNGVDCDNPWAAFWWSRAYTGSSTTPLNLMNAYNDPRAKIYNVDFFETNAVGVPGNTTQAGLTEAINAPAWLNDGAATIHLMSLSELYFILAEAKARLSQDGSENFIDGVTASYADYTTFGNLYEEEYAAYVEAKEKEAEDAGVEFDSKNILTYELFADSLYSDFKTDVLLPAYQANALKAIFEQKYIAQLRDEQVECYNDIRRCKALGETYITLTNPLNTQGGSNYWPLRLPYGNSAVTCNPNMESASKKVDIYTNPIWLFGGDR
jgi:hypothetical protein